MLLFACAAAKEASELQDTHYQQDLACQSPNWVKKTLGVQLTIDSVSTVPSTGGEVLVSPAGGSLSRLQRFDVALMIEAGAAAVRSVQSTIGGQPGPFSYPGNCSLTPSNSPVG